MNLSFLVDKYQKSVLKKLYLEGKIIDSTTFQNCKIFNEQNWDCSTREKLDFKNQSLVHTNEDKMTDGIYISTHTSNMYSNTIVNVLDVGHCAK